MLYHLVLYLAFGILVRFLEVIFFLLGDCEWYNKNTKSSKEKAENSPLHLHYQIWLANGVGPRIVPGHELNKCNVTFFTQMFLRW